MKQHHGTLDLMRGIAACAVLLLHIGRLFGLPLRFGSAHLGVDFFFLLSGFVIANAYEDKLTSGWPIRAFVRKRAIRLYPMVIVGAALGLSVLLMRQMHSHDLGWTNLLLAALNNALLLPSDALLLPTSALQAFRVFSFPLNSPFWSLSVEAAVNLAYARTVRALTTGRLCLLTGLAFAVLAVMVHLRSTIDVGFTWSDYGLGIVRALFPFLLGVLIFRLRDRLPNPGWLAHLAAPAIALVLLNPVPLPPFVELALVALGFPLAIILGLRCEPPKALKGIWQGLGALSYPLYAVHYPIVAVFAQASKQHHLGGAPELALAGLCGLSALVVAYASLKLFDEPLRRRLDRGQSAVELRPAQASST